MSITNNHSLYDFNLNRIDGTPQSLSDYKGKVLLLVNVASKCGLTPQYADLQLLYEKYKSQGLEVLAFPANDFGAQEPGTEAEIQEFCTTNYGVTFPMFAKISVKGEDIHPLYNYLTQQSDTAVKWNFQKYLINRAGVITNVFEPTTTVEDHKIITAIEALL